MGFTIGIIILAVILVVGPMMWLREGSQPISKFKQLKPLQERGEKAEGDAREEQIQEILIESNGKKKGE